MLWNGRVNVSLFWGWSGASLTVVGVVGWKSRCFGGDLLDISPLWCWTGGCLVVFGVSGWKSHRFESVRVEVLSFWGCRGGSLVVLGVWYPTLLWGLKKQELFCFPIDLSVNFGPIFKVPCSDNFLSWYYCLFCTRTNIWFKGDNFILV